MTPTASPSASLRARPFRGLRFTGPDHVVGARTFSPPDTWTDVPAHSPEEHPGLRTLLGSALGAPGSDSGGALDSWLLTGALEREESPAMYVYRRTDQAGTTMTGVVCAVRLDDTSLLPHEGVLPRLVGAQADLAAGTSAQWDPIVAMRPGRARIAPLLVPVTSRPPEVRVAEDGVTHELWTVTDSATHLAVDRATRAEPSVIADGHHRFQAWRSLRDRGEPWAWGLAMLVDAADLRLGPVHRVVDAASARAVLTSSAATTHALDALDDAYAFVDGQDAQGNRAAVVVDGSAHAVETPECAVQWVHREMPLSGPDASIDYVHDGHAAVALAERRHGGAILMAAPTFDSVVGAAVRGTLLPHKASSFGPKPRVGLVLRHWAHGMDDLRAG